MRDPERALRWLTSVNYYRLSAYFLPFKEGENFRPGSDFNDIAGLYIFDRKLRLLMLDAIERIEVAIRTAVTYEIAHTYGPFGHTEPANFSSDFKHERFMDDLNTEERRARETFTKHFREKYGEDPCLPVWMATELLSFGTVSKLYQSLQPKLRQRIARPYGVDAKFLISWLHVLTYIRNVCAHHKRLWNRHLAIRPKIPSKKVITPLTIPDTGRLYAVVVVVRYLMTVISPHSLWQDRLTGLLAEHPDVSLAAMGFPCADRFSIPVRPAC
ncbi:MAG TPA: Abi family protein [Castellaniella sp.]|uniref:Abi family protein n=1 Tax=Castellaniella sp. TaxID=1955812 RepID=UPI002EDF70B9